MQIYSRDAQQQALGFLNAQLTHIEAEVVKIKYPDVQYKELIPVDTSANEWAKSVTYMSVDQFGRAGWFHHSAKDIPLADVSREKHEVGIELAGIGYRYTMEELGQAMMIPGMNLNADRAGAARRAYEEFIDNVALRGDSQKGWTGLINDPDVPVALVPSDSTTDPGSPAWSDKTPDQVLRDANAALSGMYTETLTVEMADTLLIPITVSTDIATRRIPDTTMTIMQFLQLHNVYTAQTGQQLTIRAVRGLESAGEGGTGRMVAYRRDPQVLKMHIPMRHRFLPVWQTGPLTFDIPGIFRTGPLEIRRPQAVRYIDGITNAEYE
jgi:hypothetical protein